MGETKGGDEMITRELESFVVIARTGSFQKASEQLFISATALMKQINSLETELEVKLFVRTNKGVFLTEAGKIFCEAANSILCQYYDAVQAARKASQRHSKPIRVGISPVNPYKNFTEVFHYDRDLFSQFTSYMVPISSEYKDFTDELRNLGTRVDVIPYFCGHLGLDAVCRTFCLARVPLRVAVPVDNPLARKSCLTYEDLEEMTLITISGESNSYYRDFNRDILKHAPTVKLAVSNYFDFSVLNYAANFDQLVLVGDYLQHAHPLLRLMPVKWSHTLPYGIHYARNPSEPVRELLQAFVDSGISGKPEDAPFVEF